MAALRVRIEGRVNMETPEIFFHKIESTLSGWNLLPWSLLVAALLWILAWFLGARQKQSKSLAPAILALAGTLVIGLFMAELWRFLGRPPMRTLGETRMWHTFFLSLMVGIVYIFHKWVWMLILGHSGALLFGIFTLLNPDWTDRTLRPALQSPWFIPHVATYMVSYAFLSAASIAACYALLPMVQRGGYLKHIDVAERLTRLGLLFLTFGMILGAYWAKESWGHYWSWDPKETWALITWLGLIFLLHYRNLYPEKHKMYAVYIVITLVLLLICWFGVQYLPSTAASMHTYTS
jgi:ABC-type transport system involved in cytochrome c biogenesis permease subunit